MLKSLTLKNVGPAPEMRLDLAPRLNLITGDNGLGKSFLLDVAWWALTRHWPHEVNPRLTQGFMAKPRDLKKPATLGFELTSRANAKITYTSTYVPRDEAWTGKPGRPPNPGLVIYAQSDGGFSVWDPARNYWRKRGGVDVQDRVPAYVFSPRQVWDGLEVERDGVPTPVCNGLIRDWAGWIREGDDNAEGMAFILEGLSPAGEDGLLRPGPLARVSLDDVRDVPTLVTDYAEAVPILHASSGVRRAVALAYMLLWTWAEHRRAAELIGEEPTLHVVMIIDEIESHLHPRWQRSILGSILDLAKVLHEDAAVQVIAATHSPLVLASAEPLFNVETDAWFDLDLQRSKGAAAVVLQKREFLRRGTAGRWLTSDAFDLKSEGRSIPAEAAIQHAEELVARANTDKPPTKREITKANTALSEVLSDVDRFWIRWSAFVEDFRGHG